MTEGELSTSPPNKNFANVLNGLLGGKIAKFKHHQIFRIYGNYYHLIITSAMAWRWFTAFHERLVIASAVMKGQTELIAIFIQRFEITESFKELLKPVRASSVQARNLSPIHFKSSGFIFQQTLVGESILSVWSDTKSRSSTSIDLTATLEAKTILQTS